MFLKAFQRLHWALFPQVSYYRVLFSLVSLWNVRLGFYEQPLIQSNKNQNSKFKFKCQQLGMFLKAFQRLHKSLFPQISYYRALFSQVSLWNVRIGYVMLGYAEFRAYKACWIYPISVSRQDYQGVVIHRYFVVSQNTIQLFELSIWISRRYIFPKY